MWYRSDFEDGDKPSKPDDSGSITTSLSFKPPTQHYFGHDNDSIPTVHIKTSSSSLPYKSFIMPASQCKTSQWSRSCQLLIPVMNPFGAPNCLDVKDAQPIRRWSSLTKLSSRADKSSTRISVNQYNPDSQGSLDRGLLYQYRKEALGSSMDLNLPLSSSLLCHDWLQCSSGAKQCSGYNHSSVSTGLEKDLSLSSTLSSPLKHNSLDKNSSTLPEAKTAQMPMDTTSPVNTVATVKEGLLMQRELEIDRQKQQILQLSARIKENELRAQQVLQNQRGKFDDTHILNTKELVTKTSRKQPSDEDIRMKLAIAELEVLHLNEFFRKVTEKYTEDIKKLQDKIKTRDRYISSLKRKCQKESEQNQEKQQRIETLEKYLSDLPMLDEVQYQIQQDEVQEKAMDLEKTMFKLQKSLVEGCALIKEKNIKIEVQAKREKELITSVHCLQKKVQQCLDDGVRLPVQDLKQLEVENTELLEQQDQSSRLIESQTAQIERLKAQLKEHSRFTEDFKQILIPENLCAQSVRESRCQNHQVTGEGLMVHPLSNAEIPKIGRLLKEMSLCLLDLQALYSILSQRAQGKEPNLSLLLGMKSLSVSLEESDCRVVGEDELRLKLLEVGQLKRDIDELRKRISDRCVQYMDNSCVSQ